MKLLLLILFLLPLMASAQSKPANLHDSAAKYYAKMIRYRELSGYTKDTAVQNKCLHFAATAEMHWYYWFQLFDDSIIHSKMKP